MKFRPLTASEIDCRVSTINEKGLTLLLYKDARVDMNILDETFGVTGWQRKHEIIGGNLYCTVSIWDDKKQQWISKQDVGVESYTEKEKGQASDAFKRACFNFGIGRELYTAPFIWVNAGDYTVSKNKEGKPTTYDRFKVSQISYDGNRIDGLTIMNEKRDAVVFKLWNDDKTKTVSQDVVVGLKMACEKRKAPEKVLLDLFKVKALEDIKVADYQKMRAKIPGILDENKGKDN